MRKILLSALCFGAMTTVALAEPRELSDGQLDGVTAAGLIKVWQTHKNYANVYQKAFSANKVTSASVGLCKLCLVSSKAYGTSTAVNNATVFQGSHVGGP